MRWHRIIRSLAKRRQYKVRDNRAYCSLLPGSYFVVVVFPFALLLEREHMEHGVYWIWKDVNKGKAQDNYITVSGTEFFTIMNDERQDRHFIWMKGESAEDTIYLETALEDYREWEAERKRAKYKTRQQGGYRSCSLDMILRSESTGENSLEDLLVGDFDLEALEEDREFIEYIEDALSEWDEQERFIAQVRFLAEEPMPITEIAERLEISYKTARSWVGHVRGRLAVMMVMYDPILVERYAGGSYV